MANPAITGSMTLRQYSAVVDVSTTSTENILGNTAGSNKSMEVLLSVMNADGSNAATIDIWVYNQDGVPMNSDAGAYQAAIGADTVAGSALGEIAPKTLSVAAGGGQVVFDKLNPFILLEDQSIVVQVSAADDLTVVLTWTVKG